MAKKALIYGLSGQDGFYLSKLLSEKGYEVEGVCRKNCVCKHVEKIHVADLAGEPSVFLSSIQDFCPDEIYNLAGMSSMSEAETNSELAFKVNSDAVKRMLECIKKSCPGARFFQASSAYLFSGTQRVDEQTAPNPSTAYGRSKLRAHTAVVASRSLGIFACNGILFNHESPRRGENFVTRKISLGAARIKLGLADGLTLGNLDARRDWGFAGDYVEAMWLMLQQKEPDDYVIATGETHTVRDFCREAFSHAGLDWEKCVEFDAELARAGEPVLSADISRARRKLGWQPKVPFKKLVDMMVDEDIRRLSGGIS